jgi:hypothetical protein
LKSRPFRPGLPPDCVARFCMHVWFQNRPREKKKKKKKTFFVTKKKEKQKKNHDKWRRSHSSRGRRRGHFPPLDFPGKWAPSFAIDGVIFLQRHFFGRVCLFVCLNVFYSWISGSRWSARHTRDFFFCFSSCKPPLEGKIPHCSTPHTRIHEMESTHARVRHTMHTCWSLEYCFSSFVFPVFKYFSKKKKKLIS